MVVDNNTINLSSTGFNYNLTINRTSNTLTTFIAQGATATNSNYSEENTWLKLKSDNPPQMTLSNLAGTYVLNGVTVNYNDGTYQTQNEFTSISGSMTITSTGAMTQSFVINGTPASASGVLSIVNDVTLDVTNGSLNYQIGTSYDGTYFFTYVPSSVGFGYSELDKWTKTSN